MDWVVEGEDVLFQCRASYKGRAGTLFATNKRVAWYASLFRSLSLSLSFLLTPKERYQTSVSIPQISLPLELLRGLFVRALFFLRFWR